MKCDELKSHNAYNRWTDEGWPTPNDDLICCEYYLRSEADKVIAGLKADYKEACGRLQTANLIKDEQLTATRHQKYKRCLAMAMWCRTSARYDEGLSAFKYRDWYWKWHKRWLELAKKFNEGLVIGFDKATGTDKTVVINYKEAK